MKIIVLITRSLLGIVFLVFGFNFFFHFISSPPPTGVAAEFAGGLFKAGYFFPFMKVIEISSGLFLLINRYTALFLVIIFPVTLNIFLYHAFLLPSGLIIALPLLLINLFLGYAYRSYYSGLFTSKPVV